MGAETVGLRGRWSGIERGKLGVGGGKGWQECEAGQKQTMGAGGAGGVERPSDIARGEDESSFASPLLCLCEAFNALSTAGSPARTCWCPGWRW